MNHFTKERFNDLVQIFVPPTRVRAINSMTPPPKKNKKIKSYLIFGRTERCSPTKGNLLLKFLIQGGVKLDANRLNAVMRVQVTVIG